MAKKTLYKIFAFGVSVITITAVLILSVFYSYSDNQLKEQLRVVESVVENQLAQDDDTAFISNHIDKNVRITLVAKDGAVVADSQESANKLGNHLNRQEIQQAIKNGEATVTRHSDTQEKKVYYFAKQLDNGNILRVSTEAKSIGKFFSDYIIYIILCIIVVIVAAVFVSMGITKSIVKPITQLGQSLDNIDKFKSDEELKPLVNALLQQKKKQKMLDKQKKQFTANVSHELKTPLTSIAGYAELIETGMAKPEDIKPFAGVIRKQALRLVNLSEDIIQLSQLEESDDEDMSFESVNLYEIAQRCVEALNINAINKCVTLNLTGEECYIRGKAQLVEELVYNLCDNAIRYNKENGNVTVTVTSLEKGASVSVKDTGIGIPKKYQERIFERFFRVDKSRSKATGGTGLGLAIVKHITQLHDAKLEISSEEGKVTIYSKGNFCMKRKSGLSKFNGFLAIVLVICLAATAFVINKYPKIEAADANGGADAKDVAVIDEFKAGTYGGKEFKTQEDVVNYYKECYDYTKTLTAEYKTDSGETHSYYKMLGTETLEVNNLLVEGKSNDIINKLVPGIVGGLFKGGTNGLSPSGNRDPKGDTKNDGKMDCTTSHLTADDVLAANVKDNNDGTITMVIQPKEALLSTPGEDSQGRFFNSLGDISSVVESISVLSFSQGTVKDNFVVDYKGGTGTFVIDTKTNEITKADYTMLVHIDVKHANVAVLKDKSASLDIKYQCEYPASDDYLAGQNIGLTRVK